MRKVLINIHMDIVFIFITSSIWLKQIFFSKYYLEELGANIKILSPQIVIYLAFVLSLTSISFLFSGRRKIIVLIAIDLITTLYIIWCICKFKYSGSYFLPNNIKQNFLIIIKQFKFIYIILLLDIIFLVILFILKKNIYKSISRSILTFFVIFCFSLTYIIFQSYKVDKLNLTNNSQKVFTNDWEDSFRIYNEGILGHDIIRLYKFCAKKDYKLKKDEIDFLENVIIKSQNDNKNNKYFGTFKGYNLILLQVESLEKFVLNRDVGKEEITPNLNKILKNSIYFNNIYSHTALSVSIDSDWIINTGMFPPINEQISYDFNNIVCKYTLPKILNLNGYYTELNHADTGHGWNMYELVSKFGYNKINTKRNFNSIEKFGIGVMDHEFLPQVANNMKNIQQPFCSYNVTVTSHGPFDIPINHRKLKLSDELSNNKLGNYFQAIRYTDEAIGSFIKKLDKNGILDNSLVIIYGDHGGVHKYYNEDIKKLKSTENWYFEDEKIPFIIYNPNISGQTINTIGGQVDIMSTVYPLLGIERNEYFSFGKDLFNTHENFTKFNNTYKGDVSEEDKESYENKLKANELMLKSNYFKKYYD